MIITKKEPYTKEEIEKLSEEFETYIKTVIDIEKKVCSAGANRHFENEAILLKQGSTQSDLWGGGIDLTSLAIDNNSMINIRPNDNNLSNEIQDPEKRQIFEQLTKFFFALIWTK
ncbi:MAG: DUF5674 family protein [Candidatus Curtissbacteria bacterium]|nr:DUF5674 family protein [Candidatus Curtissbacteria bacterium]